jgi:N-formylglutamate amidohydrolase
MTAPDPEFDNPFSLERPLGERAALVVNVPHAGACYPASLRERSRLTDLALRRSEDAYVDQLFSGAPALGASLLVARFPRAFVDLNREPYELDPCLLSGVIPPFANTRSQRVAGGLGTIPRLVADGQEIYKEKLPVDEALRRIETLYKPYHRMLRQLLYDNAASHGYVLLIDGHSMPSTGQEGHHPDIVLGDRYGSSCAPALVNEIERLLRSEGLGCVRNRPYAGGFITEHYGEPGLSRHALQIEINRGLYMNEKTLMPKQAFPQLKASLTRVLKEVINSLPEYLDNRPIAAE